MLMERVHLQTANLAKDAANTCTYSGCLSDVRICFNPNQPQRSVSSNCSPRHRSINQQVRSISAKHPLESKHGKLYTLTAMLQASRAKVLLHCASTPLVPLHFQLKVRCLLCAFFSTPECPSLWHVSNAMIAQHHHSMMLFQNHVASQTFVTCLNKQVKHSRSFCGEVALSIFTDVCDRIRSLHSGSVLRFAPRKGHGIHKFTDLHWFECAASLHHELGGPPFVGIDLDCIPRRYPRGSRARPSGVFGKSKTLRLFGRI